MKNITVRALGLAAIVALSLASSFADPGMACCFNPGNPKMACCFNHGNPKMACCHEQYKHSGKHQ